jgi:hypothetical protein
MKKTFIPMQIKFLETAKELEYESPTVFFSKSTWEKLGDLAPILFRGHCLLPNNRVSAYFTIGVNYTEEVLKQNGYEVELNYC